VQIPKNATKEQIQEALEAQFMEVLSSLHNLGYETGKVKLFQNNDKLEQ